MNVSRVVRNGRSRAGSAIPVLVSAASTAGRPTRLISMLAAVLSLMEIIIGGRVLHGDPGAVRLILEFPGGQALELRGDGQRLVPADRAGDGVAQRVEYVEREDRGERRRGGRVYAVYRLA
jgi:hypothetical protein